MAGFNADILFFHPSTRILGNTVSKMETADFRFKVAEQSYLNHYFGAESIPLPYAYGGNLAIKERSPEMWEMMRSGMRIVHGTVVKTSTSKRSARTLVYDLNKQEVWVKKAKTKLGGQFAPELAWWEESFNPAMRGIGNVFYQPVIDLIVHRCISRLGTSYMLWKYPASSPRRWIVGFI